MPSPPKPKHTTVNVEVYAVNAQGNANFKLFPQQPDPLPISNGTLSFKNEHFPGFHLDFVLIDKTGQNYVFPTDEKQAVSSLFGNKTLCPLHEVTKHPVLQPIKVGGKNNCTLTVHNKNCDDVVGDFSYALWITKDGGKSFARIDPGGINMNGPTSFRLTTSITLAVLVSAAAAALVFLRPRFLRRK